MKSALAAIAALVLLLTITPAQAKELPEQSWLLIAQGDVPRGVKAQIERAGGEVTNVVEEAGLVVASSSDPGFRARMSHSFTVVPNVVVPMTPPGERVVEFAGNPPNSGDNDRFFDLQWGLDAVNAPEAWAAGSRGKGALVAVLDGGFSLEHPDLVENIVDSADMTGEGIEYGPNFRDFTGINSHGMHVAGTIAAADNGVGVIGVAPEAQLLLVKVLFNYGSGTYEDVVEGIVYAANYGGVDVINMSLGADVPQGLGIGSKEAAALRVLMNRAISHASQEGITVIVSAGNDGRDLDADRSLTVFPAQLANAISISATGPEGWAVDPTTDLDTLAGYSNYGRSGIDFAAPGGDYDWWVDDPVKALASCSVAGLTRACYVFDYVFSTGGVVDSTPWYYWSVGTSMAAPHAAGVAALIIGENGGAMEPAQVKAEMMRRADDLGQPGKDPKFGAGRVSSGY